MSENTDFAVVVGQYTERFVDDIKVEVIRDPETREEFVSVTRYISKVHDEPTKNQDWAGGVKIGLANTTMEKLHNQVRDAIRRLKAAPLPETHGRVE